MLQRWLVSRPPGSPGDDGLADSDFQRSLLTAVIEASPDGILVVDGQGIVVAHNARFIEVWGLPGELVRLDSPGAAVGISDDPILAEVVRRVSDPDAFLGRVRELYANPQHEDHCEVALRDGRTLERDSRAVFGENDRYLGRVWFFRDITKQKESAARLEAEARRDSLTGILNRRYFFERGKQEFDRAARYGGPLAVAEFDIDHFKRINDRYGHAAGDELLQTVCAASSAIIRKTNLFARIGGEEFAVMLVESDLAGAMRFAELLRATVAQASLVFEGQPLACTISVGVAELRRDDASIDDCLQRADRAMYRAKTGGRNRVVACS